MEEINYSDGSIEDEILRIVRDKTQRPIDQGNWPIVYHLSKQRNNLLKHLDFTGLEVLELGGGMGAISEYLAQNCKFLTVVEGTKKRSEVIKERLSNFNNYEIITGNFENFKSEKKFDVVTLIGVLEYSEVFINSEDPFSFVLNLTNELLKEDGVLIIAIENKNGLKYWKGCTEDHSGLYFDGICNYKKSKSAKTFSRYELKELIYKTGYKKIYEYYPWPDYKLPNSIISEELFGKYPDLAADLAKINPGKHLGQNDLELFPERLAIDNLSKSNLLRDFSNSFLFICGKGKLSSYQKINKNRDSGILAWHYSQNRKKATQTVFREENNQLVVKKEFEGNVPQFSESILNEIESLLPFQESYIKGQKVVDILLRYAFYNEWESFFAELISFLNWGVTKFKIDNSSRLMGKAIDALSHNAIKEKNGYGFFDLEWHSKSTIPIHYFIFRNVLILQRYPKFFYSCPFRNFKEIFEFCCRKLNIDSNIDNSAMLESILLNEACGINEKIKEILDSAFLKSFKDHFPFSANGSIFQLSFEELSQTKQEFSQTKQEFSQTKQEFSQTKQELSQTKQELSQTKQELSQTKQELSQTRQELSQTKQELSQTKQELIIRKNQIENILLSRSWRMTSPIRASTSLLRNLRDYCGLKKTGRFNTQ